MKRSLLGFAITTGIVHSSGYANAESISCSGTQNVSCFTVEQSPGGNSAIYASQSGNGGAAVEGQNDDGNVGVYGKSLGSATGVEGSSVGYNGVFGLSFSNFASGVYGETDGNGYGVAGRVQPAGSGTAVYGDNTSTSGWSGFFTGRVGIQGTPTANQTTFTLFNSDARLKTHIEPLTGALDRLVQLRGVTYEWKEPEKHGHQTGPQRGFIAQEVEKVFPDWVSFDDSGYRTLTLRGLEPMVVESIKTLKAQNDDLRAQSSKLERRIRDLEANRRPLLGSLGWNGQGIAGLMALGGAFVLARRQRSGAKS